MNFDASRVAFETFVTPTLLGIPVEYDNAPDNAELKAAKEARTAWARLTVLQGTGFATEIGRKPNRRWPSLVIVSFFVPTNTGTKEARDRATTLAQAILDHSFTDILVRTPELIILGRDKESPDWYQVNLSVPFELNQLTT